jgi:plastocyanin
MVFLEQHFRLILICLTAIVVSASAAFAVIAVVAIIAGDSSSFTPRSDPGPPVREITIVGEDSRFEPDAFTVQGGAEITVTFDNRDRGVAHNINFQDVGGAETDVEQGPDVRAVTFVAPASPGEYWFRCDVHPRTMRGILYVQ